MSDSAGKIGPGGIPIDKSRFKGTTEEPDAKFAFGNALSQAIEKYGETATSSPTAAPASPKQLPPGATHPSHFPMPGAVVVKGTGDSDEMHERALHFRSYRQELLASNIANADTPNYKAVDIDVEAALAAGYTRIEDIPLQYREPTQDSIDGNTVEIDYERAEFARNAIMYQFTLNKVGHEYEEMADLFKKLSM